MNCSRCGHRNERGARFCTKCGSALDEGTTAGFSPEDLAEEMQRRSAQSPVELQPGQGVLVVLRGPNAGSRFLIDQEVTTIGRHAESDVFLDDVTVSRRHAELRRERGGFVLRDAGSLNGSYVNRLRAETARLQGGDEIQIGRFRLQFFACRSGARGRG